MLFFHHIPAYLAVLFPEQASFCAKITATVLQGQREEQRVSLEMNRSRTENFEMRGNKPDSGGGLHPVPEITTGLAGLRV